MRRTTALPRVLALAVALTLVPGGAAQQPVPAPANPEVLDRLQQAEAELRRIREQLNPAPPAPSPAAAAPAASEAKPATDAPAPKYPTVQVGGAFQADVGWFSQSEANRRSVGDAEDGAAFRRARLHAIGKVAENVEYKFQMDFAFPGRPTFTDVYGDVTQLPVIGNFRFGQWKQPVGLEEVTSFRFNPFLERASIFLLKPFRHIGVGTFDWSEDELWTWQTSVFRAGQDQFGGDLGDSGGAAFALRMTHLPVYECDGSRLVHLGASYFLANPTNDRLRFGALGGNAPEFGLLSGTFGTPTFTSPPNTPSFVDTGVFAADLYQLAGLEAATVWGPVSLQGEAVVSAANRPGAPYTVFWGFYAYATWLLTGEHRGYDRKAGAFDRTVPFKDFQPWRDGCFWGGAWELAARVSFIDLDAADIAGGRLTDLTLGVNWYLNARTKFQFNYIHAFLDRAPVGDSDADVFALRGQIDF